MCDKIYVLVPASRELGKKGTRRTCIYLGMEYTIYIHTCTMSTISLYGIYEVKDIYVDMYVLVPASRELRKRGSRSRRNILVRDGRQEASQKEL